MSQSRQVSVPRGSFIFCKYSLAVIMWLALILKSKWLILFSFMVLALSALFKVGKAPMILFYSYTVNLIFKSRDEILDEAAMRFAHTLGALLTLMCLLFLYLGNERVGWMLVFVVTIFKTIGALGFCPAYKLFGCMAAGGCCRLTGAKK